MDIKRITEELELEHLNLKQKMIKAIKDYVAEHGGYIDMRDNRNRDNAYIAVESEFGGYEDKRVQGVRVKEDVLSIDACGTDDAEPITYYECDIPFGVNDCLELLEFMPEYIR